MQIRNIFLGFLLGMVVMGAFLGGALYGKKGLAGVGSNVTGGVSETKKIENEESVVTRVVEKSTPSVVTVSISKTSQAQNPMDLFGFGFFGIPYNQPQRQQQKIEQDIGSGFVIDKNGLIVTNKHVVADNGAKYKVVVNNAGKDEILEVKNIYRDPLTDMAILKVDKSDLVPVNLGDSDKLKVGQLVIAIGTALGEFRSTVTTGVISGLGRGITAGSPVDGSEKLDNVIQTDAAINPGNSGGPLLNSSGEVIGVNVAVSQSGQNIGFALPINLVKESIKNFNTTGQFERPFLGVSYTMIGQRKALLNDVVKGAYVQEIVDGPAKNAGIQAEDIITEIDSEKLDDVGGKTLAEIIAKKKVGQEVNLKVWRDGKEMDFKLKLDKMK